jgi:hypothetical protein
VSDSIGFDGTARAVLLIPHRGGNLQLSYYQIDDGGRGDRLRGPSASSKRFRKDSPSGLRANIAGKSGFHPSNSALRIWRTGFKVPFMDGILEKFSIKVAFGSVKEGKNKDKF